MKSESATDLKPGHITTNLQAPRGVLIKKILEKKNYVLTTERTTLSTEQVSHLHPCISIKLNDKPTIWY